MPRYEIIRWWIINAKDRATEITKSVVPFYHACSSIYFFSFIPSTTTFFLFTHSYFLSTEYESSSKKKLFFIPKSEIWKFIKKKKIKRFFIERDGRKNVSRFRNRSIHHHLFRPRDNHREMLPHARIPRQILWNARKPPIPSNLRNSRPSNE